MTRLRTTKPNSSGSLNQCKSTHKTQPPPNTTTDMYGSNNSPPTFLNPDEAYNCATTTLGKELLLFVMQVYQPFASTSRSFSPNRKGDGKRTPELVLHT